MIYDKIAQFRKYPYGKHWESAFQFLNKLDSNSEEKTYTLESGIYAIVSTNLTKYQSEAVLESHQKYVDIQAALDGVEAIECFDSNELIVTKEYDPENDVQFYQYPNAPKAVVIDSPGSFTALWPSDAHMPLLAKGDIAKIKKVVIKIPVLLLKTT